MKNEENKELGFNNLVNLKKLESFHVCMNIYWQLTNGEKLIYGKRIWGTQEKRYAYYTYLFSSYFKSIDPSLVDFSLLVFLIYNTVL